MASKNFYVQLILRILCLTIGMFLFSYFVLAKNFIVAGICLLGCVVLVVYLIRFVNQTNRKIAYFFESLKNEDFSLRFPEDIQEKSLRELHVSLNKVNDLIKNIQIQNKSQENYYQEILKHTKTGILTLNKNGHILFSNPTAKNILNKDQLNHVRQLQNIDSELFQLLFDLKPFERKLIEFTNERETLQLVIKSIDITLNEEVLKLVTIEDIKNELDEKETESWTKLIQVLAHEIMNTIAPISSISESILKYYQNKEGIVSADAIDENKIKNTVKGLEVIKNQGNDLMSFVQAYRSVLHIPNPDKEIVLIEDLFEKLKLLASQEMDLDKIIFKVEVPNEGFEIFVDEKQITLVLYNLLKNAVQALQNKNDGVIELYCGINNKNQKYVEVRDNGSGIPKELIQQVFIPFFTTKTSGSGIGLSLSKQILQMHGGTLHVYSTPNKETCFTLTF